MRRIRLSDDKAILGRDDGQPVVQCRSKLHGIKLHVTGAQHPRKPVVDEYHPGLGQRAWIFKEHRIGHRADKAVEAGVAWSDQPQ